MKDPHIIQLRIGFTGPVVITTGTDSVLVDTGVRGKMHEFERQFQLHGIDPRTIRLIILTHVHYDHTGNLRELKQLTGAPVVVNKREAEWLRTGLMPIPRGTYFFSRMIVALGDLLMPGYASPVPFEADILTDEYMDLSPYGIRGEIIFTPGHTEGSQSVLVGKNLISGDCFFNIRNSMVFPPFANDIRQLLKSWEKVFAMGVETIYPGHGPILKVEDAQNVFAKRMSALKA
ncbi:MAG: MBL fold metallo-hydrolase [Bacteroidota bacterium]